jgi:hypothetical protein
VLYPNHSPNPSWLVYPGWLAGCYVDTLHHSVLWLLSCHLITLSVVASCYGHILTTLDSRPVQHLAEAS